MPSKHSIIIESLSLHPNQSTKELRKQLDEESDKDITSSQAHAVCQWLEKLNIIEVVDRKPTGHGRPMKIWKLSKRGKEILDEYGNYDVFRLEKCDRRRAILETYI